MKINLNRIIPHALFGDKILQKNFVLAMLICVVNVAIAMGVSIYNYSTFLTLYPNSWIPYWMLGDAIIIIVIGNITSRYTPKNIKKYTQAIQYISIAVVMLLLCLNLTSWHFMPLTTIFTLRAVSSITGIIVWSLFSILFYHKQYKKIINYLTIAGSLTSIITPMIIAKIVYYFNLNSIVVLILLLLVISVAIVSHTHEILTAAADDTNNSKQTSTSPFQYPLFKSLYMLYFVFYILVFFADFFFKKELNLHFSKNEITDVISHFLILTNVLSLIMLLLSPIIIAKLKFYVMLQAMFLLVSIIGLIYFLNQNLIWPVITLNVIMTSFSFGYFNITIKNIRNIFPPTIIVKTDIYLKTYGGALASILVSILAIVARQVYNLSLMFVVLSMVGIFISYQLFVRYLSTLQKMISKSNLNLLKINEKDLDNFRQLILNNLNHPNIQPLEIAMITPKLFPEAPKLLYYIISSKKDETLIYSALKALSLYHTNKLDISTLIDIYKKHILSQKNREILCKILSDIHSNSILSDIREQHKNNIITKNSLLLLLKNGDTSDYIFALKTIVEFTESDIVANRIIAAKVLHSLGDGRFYDIKTKLLTDKDHLVRLEAFSHLPIQDIKYMLPKLVKFLNTNTINLIHKKFELNDLMDFAKQIMYLLEKNPDEYMLLAINFITQIPSQNLEEYIVRFIKQKNNYYRTCLAIKLLERKKTITLSDSINSALLDSLQFELLLIENYQGLLVNKEFQVYKVILNNRIYHAKQRFLYWYAAYSVDSESILSSIDELNPYLLLDSNRNIQGKAIEFLITKENNTHIQKLIEQLFNESNYPKATKTSSEWLNMLSENDVWLSKVLSEKFTKGVGTMNSLQKAIALQQTEFFESLPDEILFEISNQCEVLECAPNQTIIEEGYDGDNLYILVDGEVNIYKNGTLLNTLKPFACFGEMALLGSEKRTSTAITNKDATLIVLNKDNFLSIPNEFPQILFKIIKIIISRFNDQLSLLEENK
jgi:hypothetical protein